MELNIVPQKADATVYEGEGGGYYAWSAAVLGQAEVGAGKLVLRPRGFALPHYSDTYKIGYVAQGTCTVGIVLPNSAEEKILIIKKGYAIPVTMGSISWWFNGGDSDVTVFFLGESSRSYNPGQFDYFLVAGAAGVLGGFSTEFISKIYDFDESSSEKLVKSQTNALIFKIGAEIKMPDQSNCKLEEYVFNLGSSNEMTGENLPLLDKFGLSASLIGLKPNCVMGPTYSVDGSYRIIYVTKGSGRVQIVGLNGAQLLDADVEEGQLFVVPRYFVVALIADGNGMEFFSVSTSSRPVNGQLSGDTSAYKALSSSVLEVALNVSPEFVKLFKSKI